MKKFDFLDKGEGRSLKLIDVNSDKKKASDFYDKKNPNFNRCIYNITISLSVVIAWTDLQNL